MTEKIVNLEEVERTLRLVAGLDAPLGLAERVKARVAPAQAAPARGRLLAWPQSRAGRAQWLRGAIAAGLLAAVAAGGAVAYRWVAPASMAHTAPATARPAVQQKFSTAGAMRTPLTLQGPAAPLATHPRTAVASTARGSGRGK
jgi:hypothetical protein